MDGNRTPSQPVSLWRPLEDLFPKKSSEPKVYTKQNTTLTIYPLTKLVHRSSRMRNFKNRITTTFSWSEVEAERWLSREERKKTQRKVHLD